MSKILFPSEVTAETTNSVVLVPVDLQKEDPALLEMLRLQGEHEANLAERFAQSWYRSGTGQLLVLAVHGLLAAHWYPLD